MTTPRRLSEIAYSIYSQLHSYQRPFLYPQPEDAQCRGDSDPPVRIHSDIYCVTQHFSATLIHEVQNKIFYKFCRFFLLKMPATRAQYLLFRPQKS